MSSLEASVLRAIQGRSTPAEPSLGMSLFPPFVAGMLAAVFALNMLLIGVPRVLEATRVLNVKLPFLLVFLGELSVFLSTYVWIIAAALAIAAVASVVFRRPIAKWLVFGVPLLGRPLLENASLTVLTNLEAGLAADLSIADTMEMVVAALPPLFAQFAAVARERMVNQGMPLDEALAGTLLISQEDQWALADARQCGTTSETLRRLIERKKLNVRTLIRQIELVVWLGSSSLIGSAIAIWLTERLALIETTNSLLH